MSFYFKSGILSLVLGLTAVMVIYWVGVGSYNSTVCREQTTTRSNDWVRVQTLGIPHGICRERCLGS